MEKRIKMLLIDALENKTFDARGKGDLLLSSNLRTERIGHNKVMLDKLAPVPGDTDEVYETVVFQLPEQEVNKNNSIPFVMFIQHSTALNEALTTYQTCVELLKGIDKKENLALKNETCYFTKDEHQ
jgi:hypothetical protein